MRQALRSSHGMALRLCALLVVTFAVSISAGVNGAIYTTNSTGTAVNVNIYDLKADAYLTGGPQNQSSSGLDPDGSYYFQVTDPSGAVLLSTDDISCRQVQVTGGKIVASTGSCPHPVGTTNPANGETPVQLIPFNDTSNPGAEYKAWITPVDSYDPENCVRNGEHHGTGDFGFCDSESKTDNFKVKTATAAFVTVCKFNDVDGSGSRDAGEPLIPHWPIYATGVIAGTENALTDDAGCVSFSVSDFSDGSATVTLTEGNVGGDWTRTAPADGGSAPITIADGVISVTVHPGDSLQAPDFGNHNPFCEAGCNPNELQVSKNAYPSLKRTYVWGIGKVVDKTEIDTTAGGAATFNYTVNVTHDAGTDSDWAVNGTITVANPSGSPISGIDVTDAVDNGGNCVVPGGTGMTISAGSHAQVGYSCSYASRPANGINTATASATSVGNFTGTASVKFSAATINEIDDCINVTDSNVAAGLGQVCSGVASPTSLTYSKTVTAPNGTCNTYDNTATFTTNTSGTIGSASKSARVCGGADLTVTKTATGAYDSTIAKDVNRTLVEQAGNSFTFNYTVTVKEKNWKVSGDITVNNPNDWEAITVSLSDVVGNGGACTIAGGASVTVAASGSSIVSYSCTYAATPSAASSSNTATATWDKVAAHTANGSSSGSHDFGFASLTVKDTFDGVLTTLGTISGITPSKVYTYSHTVTATGGKCTSKNNTAEIPGSTASKTVTLCNTTTGALTMGFWQNKNGQAIITGQAKTGICPSTTWLRGYAPFQDLAATSTCAQVGTYVTNIIKAANASGAAMNAMLKAQMLATALDVYFSDPALGSNKIGAASPIGGVKVDLTQVCKMIDNSSTGGGSCSGTTVNASGAFGGATALTVSQILTYAAGQSNAGGSIWYAQVKATQELAKNTFDEINNQAAYIAP